MAAAIGIVSLKPLDEYLIGSQARGWLNWYCESSLTYKKSAVASLDERIRLFPNVVSRELTIHYYEYHKGFFEFAENGPNQMYICRIEVFFPKKIEIEMQCSSSIQALRECEKALCQKIDELYWQRFSLNNAYRSLESPKIKKAGRKGRSRQQF